MIELIAAVLVLGVAGFDPIGFVALVAAVALGAGRKATVVLLATVLCSTVLLGLAASFGLAAAVQRLFEVVPQPSTLTWGIVLVVAGIALAAWGVQRWRTRAQRAGVIPVPVRGTSTPAMFVVGLLLGLGALLDPVFYATALLAGETFSLPARCTVIIGWTLVSQIALVVGAAVVLLVPHDTARARLERLRERLSRSARSASATLLLLLGGAGVVAGILQFAKLG